MHEGENHIEINGIISAIVIGAIIGALGRLAIRGKRLAIRGKQDISVLMTLVIGIVAALIGTFIAVRLGVSSFWIELFIQVGLAAIGVTLYTGGGRSQGRSRRR